MSIAVRVTGTSSDFCKVWSGTFDVRVGIMNGMAPRNEKKHADELRAILDRFTHSVARLREEHRATIHGIQEDAERRALCAVSERLKRH